MKSALAVAALLCLVVVPTHVHAQLNDVHFNIAAGATIPSSTFGDDNNVGYNLSIGLTIPQRGSPLAFRVEGLYNEFSAKLGDLKSHAGGVTGNATFDFSQSHLGASGNTVYAIGGIGYYSTRDAFFGNNTQSNIGWNIGGGFRFPLTGFSAYIEARYHYVSNTDVRFTPITFGLQF